jgi:APA family basic amino acid/polyamine antiporter
LLPPILSAVHPRYRTPWLNTLVVGLFTASAAGFASLDALADLTNVGSLAAFAIVCITVLYMRVKAPDLRRPFRAPFSPFTPLLGAAMCIFLMMSLMSKAVTRDFFLGYLAVGIAVYFFYGLRHSKLGKGEIVIGAEPTLDLPKRLDV